ncbi:MAG TPA: cyclic nucleotide-binding domain-containing protein, partial [Vicinamibacterales bacterium]|nr:cyclic nucleotide-binding domain-containing protein [Vicinamibacterales bacterium]
ADLGPGDCFGEMSLVTGEPRAASVAARGDCLAIEIPADAFAELARVNPVAVERVAALAAERRGPLEAARLAAHAGAPATVTGGLLSRMKRWMLKTKD